ncbi:metalloregulator ArsR/SmtB family transcription factor [Streptomyces sp. NPDC026672]|uniref:ArsR/SmtB family transcription factor n=1 Tax=unclassified Streptomyces TaxID=2593676 RepID=UPI0033FB93C6
MSSATTERPSRYHHPDTAALDLATILRTVGDPLRLAIVRLVHEKERTCSEVGEVFGMPSSTNSYHLRLLREAGVTQTRRRGTQAWVSIRTDDLESRFPGLVAVLTRPEGK